MRIVLVAAGKIGRGPERALIDDYVNRANAAGRAVGLAPVDEIEVDVRAKRDRAAQTGALLAAAPAGVLCVMDERGEAPGSARFADMLGRWRDAGEPAASFVIGGADGLDPSARAQARAVLAFGGWTWPHKLARVMLAEQIYRAVSILTSSPYHRA